MHPAFSTSRLLIQRVFGGFHSHGDTPIAGWFIREHPIEIDDLGVPLFQETPTYEWTSCQHDFFKAVAKTPFEASNSWQSWLGGISWSTMWRFPKIGDPQVPMAFNTKMIYFFLDDLGISLGNPHLTQVSMTHSWIFIIIQYQNNSSSMFHPLCSSSLEDPGSVSRFQWPWCTGSVYLIIKWFGDTIST